MVILWYGHETWGKISSLHEHTIGLHARAALHPVQTCSRQGSVCILWLIYGECKEACMETHAYKIPDAFVSKISKDVSTCSQSGYVTNKIEPVVPPISKCMNAFTNELAKQMNAFKCGTVEWLNIVFV